ncbi:helix-turn-helix transcriptional regulator [bacterium]|nr:helix-turn-helix transcriptional regulator [bacterium]
MFQIEDKVFIGKKIKEQRKRMRMTQFMLAEQVGLHEKQISRIESGLNFPTLTSFINIIAALDMNLNDFIQDKKAEINPIKDDIISIIRNADNNELKIYLDIIKSLKKNLKLYKQN